MLLATEDEVLEPTADALTIVGEADEPGGIVLHELADRRISKRTHHLENSTFVRSIDEAAYLVEQGYAIRMGGIGLRPSLISPASLRITRT